MYEKNKKSKSIIRENKNMLGRDSKQKDFIYLQWLLFYEKRTAKEMKFVQ